MLNLTVKCIAYEGGESIIPCTEVKFNRKENRVTLWGLDHPNPSVDHIIVDNGSVYVMNANGSTVAQYHMGEGRASS